MGDDAAAGRFLDELRAGRLSAAPSARAGFSILKGTFEDETISPGGLFAAALPGTLVAVGCFQFEFFARLIA